MSFFFRGRDDDTPEQPPAPANVDPTSRANLRENIHVMSGGNWRVYDMLADIHSYLDGARVEERHLWNSSERQQGFAAATILAITRRSIAEGLLSTATVSRHAVNGLPVDVQDMVEQQYLDALRWREEADDIRQVPNYELSLPLDFETAWPTSDGSRHISKELMDGLHSVLVSSDVSPLLGLVQSHIQIETDGPYEKPIFSRYRIKLAAEYEHILRDATRIHEEWDPRIDPNVEPGRRIFNEMTTLVERFAAYSVHAMIPATLESRLIHMAKAHRFGLYDQIDDRPFNPSILTGGSVTVTPIDLPPEPVPRPPDKPFDPGVLKPQRAPKPFDPGILNPPTDSTSSSNNPGAAGKPFDPDILK